MCLTRLGDAAASLRTQVPCTIKFPPYSFFYFLSSPYPRTSKLIPLDWRDTQSKCNKSTLNDLANTCLSRFKVAHNIRPSSLHPVRHLKILLLYLHIIKYFHVQVLRYAGHLLLRNNSFIRKLTGLGYLYILRYSYPVCLLNRMIVHHQEAK